MAGPIADEDELAVVGGEAAGGEVEQLLMGGRVAGNALDGGERTGGLGHDWGKLRRARVGVHGAWLEIVRGWLGGARFLYCFRESLLADFQAGRFVGLGILAKSLAGPTIPVAASASVRSRPLAERVRTAGRWKVSDMTVLGHHGTKVALLAAVAAAATTATASTLTISTDFYGTAVEANRLLPTDVAGAPAYAASNWNLLVGETIAPATAVLLHDSDGSNTGVGISISNGPGRLQSFGGTPVTGNAKLYNGAVGRDHWFSAMTFTLTGVGALRQL